MNKLMIGVEDYYKASWVIQQIKERVSELEKDIDITENMDLAIYKAFRINELTILLERLEK